jgi:methyl-accepting chemotaxis protein
VSIAIVPGDELAAVGIDQTLRLDPKETPNGTIVPGESDGALAIVAAAPFHDGVLVAVRSLKLNYELVDSVVAKAGGTSTLFQNGMRVSTTVRGEDGQRAVGTVISDTVREATLERGETYHGEAFVVTTRYLTAYEPLRNGAGDIIGMLYVGIDQAPYAAATRGFALTFGAVIIAAFLIALLSAVNVSRALTRPLAGLGEAAATVATGDLTAQVPALGYKEARELGNAFNTMTGGLRTIIAQVEQSVMQLRSVSGEITAASRSSAEHATHQASSVAQTTATLQELTASFQAVADGARRVLDVAEDALESAQGGVGAVDKTHEAMDELTTGAQSMAEAATAMTEVAADITEMTGIITGIAEQTKILALNAAIEAARAGEAGKGFAVVSTEIRTLADSVGRSAGRISDLVAGIQSASTRLQDEAARQRLLTEDTVSASRESRDAFGLIVRQMEDTAFAAREITDATVQQKRASDQLVQAMQQVSLSSNETAAAAKQLADSADSVETEAESLMSVLTRFRTR